MPASSQPRPLPTPAGCTLAVLVGGRGTRLGGRAKGNLKYAGQTLLERTLALVPLFGDCVLVGDDAGAYPEAQVRRAPDRAAGFAAPGGLVSALFAAQAPWALVVACDMPGLSEAAVRLLFSAAGEDGACFVDERGALQPFPGLFRVELRAGLERALSPGISVRALLAPLKLARVPVPAGGSGPSAVSNVNTWDDVRALGVDPT